MNKYRELNSQVRADFPIFKHRSNLVYLDSTATALKPKPVILAMNDYYEDYSANVFRGLYPISELATKKYEEAREVVAEFIHAPSKDEVVFVRNTTEALNLIAYTLGREIITTKSEIVISVAEHHANFVPWQQLALENDATLKVLEVDERGVVPLDNIDFAKEVIGEQTKILALFYVSNVLGTINPIKKIIKNVRQINPDTIIIVDAAQAIPSLEVNVADLDCDFLCFSGHKALGPTGIGVLWGKHKWLSAMPPFHYGGEMIKEVSLEASTFQEPPLKFEAGTPAIAEAIGLATALKYLSQFSFAAILEHERHLWQLAYTGLKNNPHIRLLGPETIDNRTGILTFTHDLIHAHDLSQILANKNICIRAGHHCAMPLHTQLKIDASARASFYFYNTEEDVRLFLEGLKEAEKLFLR